MELPRAESFMPTRGFEPASFDICFGCHYISFTFLLFANLWFARLISQEMKGSGCKSRAAAQL